MFPIENNDTFLLFFHGLDSSNVPARDRGITREPKYCQTVNYRSIFLEVFRFTMRWSVKKWHSIREWY